jgi:glucose/arabinose dehydrogenase
MNTNLLGPSWTVWPLALALTACTSGSGLFADDDVDTPGTAGDVGGDNDVGVGGEDAGGGSAVRVPCDRDNAGLQLLPGFCASIVADDVGMARHIAVTPSGDIYVALWEDAGSPTGGLLALRDTDGDGKTDVQRRIVDGGGSGVYWREGKLYFGQDDRILRFDAPDGELLEEGTPTEVVVSGLPADGDHTAKSIVVNRQGDLFVNIGSASNSCQVVNREAGSLGVDPCPELDVRAGIWQFDANGTNQLQTDGIRYATGIRNGNAMALKNGKLVVLQNGRDALYEDWGSIYSPFEGAMLPSEELLVVQQDGDYGWPYCYHDPIAGMVLAPEYGGDGVTQDRCASVLGPDVAFPAHWAPLTIAFAEGEQLPRMLRRGAFIAFHGSHHAMEDVGPLPGYQIDWIGWDRNGPTTERLMFAWDFVGDFTGDLPEAAEHRPAGLAMAPDGTLLVTDDQSGRIYRISWTLSPPDEVPSSPDGPDAPDAP